MINNNLKSFIIMLNINAILIFCFNPQHNQILKIMLFLIFVDICSGVSKAIHNTDFKLSVIKQSFHTKIWEIVLVSMCWQMDKIGMFADIIDMQKTIMLCYISYECISIISNIKEFVYIPEAITKNLEKIQNGGGGK
jgi:toxin secretion/phage lysis holin